MTQTASDLDTLLDELGSAIHRYRNRSRRRARRALALAATLCLLAVALGASYGALFGTAPPFRTVGTPFHLPAFAGRDVVTGKHVSTAELGGKPGFVLVWQSYCRPCAPSLLALDIFAKRHPSTPVIGLDIADTRTIAKPQLMKVRAKFAFIAIGPGASQSLQIEGYPSVLAVDASGKVVAIAPGPITPGALQRELRVLESRH